MALDLYKLARKFNAPEGFRVAAPEKFVDYNTRFVDSKHLPDSDVRAFLSYAVRNLLEAAEALPQNLDPRLEADYRQIHAALFSNWHNPVPGFPLYYLWQETHGYGLCAVILAQLPAAVLACPAKHVDEDAVIEAGLVWLERLVAEHRDGGLRVDWAR